MRNFLDRRAAIQVDGEFLNSANDRRITLRSQSKFRSVVGGIAAGFSILQKNARVRSFTEKSSAFTGFIRWLWLQEEDGKGEKYFSHFSGIIDRGWRRAGLAQLGWGAARLYAVFTQSCFPVWGFFCCAEEIPAGQAPFHRIRTHSLGAAQQRLLFQNQSWKYSSG